MTDNLMNLAGGNPRLLSVHDIIGADSTIFYHLAVGYLRGSPWRFDSVYLRNDAFELIEPPFRSLPRFVPHGVTVLVHEQMGLLDAALMEFATRLETSAGPADVYGERSVYKPGLARFNDWGAARPQVAILTDQVLAGLGAQALDGHGMTIYGPGR